MKLKQKIATVLLLGITISVGAVIYTGVTALIDTKNNKIEELQENIKNNQQELDNKKQEILNITDKVKQLEEDKEAIQQELDTKSRKLREFEAILSSSVVSLTLEELDLFFRLVEAEAGNEDMRGKIAVANVVINRVRDNRYPNTIKEVIYQPYQFEPVRNGHIYKKAPADSKEAVLRALKGEEVVPRDTISFWANYLNKSHELWNLNITSRIGIHVFTNEF